MSHKEVLKEQLDAQAAIGRLVSDLSKVSKAAVCSRFSRSAFTIKGVTGGLAICNRNQLLPVHRETADTHISREVNLSSQSMQS